MQLGQGLADLVRGAGLVFRKSGTLLRMFSVWVLCVGWPSVILSITCTRLFGELLDYI